MSIRSVIPTPGELTKETILLIGSAILAAYVVGQLPGLRDWIKRQWAAAGAPVPIPTVTTL